MDAIGSKFMKKKSLNSLETLPWYATAGLVRRIVECQEGQIWSHNDETLYIFRDGKWEDIKYV